MSLDSFRSGSHAADSMKPARQSVFFPPVQQADEEGLLMLGGRLSPDWLIEAYRRGIFPWPIFGEAGPMAWWSPDPRAVIELDRLHVSHRLRRTIASGRFEVTCDCDFVGVVAGCAEPRASDSGTWITPAMARAYQRLHELGCAHSVEVWCAGRLAGGIYGVALAGLFAGESMFHRAPDASKVALAHLVEHLKARGYGLLDIQQWTPHTGRMGAVEIRRREYLSRLAEALKLPATFGAKLAPCTRETRPL